MNSDDEIQSVMKLPARSHDGHKGTFGRVLVVAGSLGMSGAAVLSGRAALRGGAGLVTVATPESVRDVVASHDPCFTTVSLPVDSDGELTSPSPDGFDDLIKGKSVVAIGPGLGQSEGAAAIVDRLLSTAQVPLVLDADALNIAATHKLLSGGARSSDCVITPHPGEFSGLTGLSAAEIASDRITHAKDFAARHGVVVVLKGHGTVVTDGRRYYVNPTGNSGMATGGSGDVLTGILAAQIAQGMDVFDASVLAVHVHGLAGDLAAVHKSQRGLIATDLIEFLGNAWLRLEDSGADK